QSPPRIVKQPPTDELLFQVRKPEERLNDRPFVIECEAEGEPAPKYRWIKNGKNFDWRAYDDRISQQPGRGTLVISSPRDEDLGQYQCFAYNEWGTATSNSVFVRKADLNNFKDQHLVTATAQEGHPYKLSCRPPDGWPKPSVFWLIQNQYQTIKTINNSRMTVDPEGNLWFTNVTRQDKSDDFTYTCAASSIFRNEFKVGVSVMLNVIQSGTSEAQSRHAPEQQYVSRRNEVAYRGSTVELYCIYGGTPLPQTVWTKNGRPLQPSERVSQGNFGKSLIIKHVEFEDEGTFTCDVSNGVGDAKSYSMKLQVMAVPYFTKEPEMINAAEGETVELKCAASGVPEPQIKWIHNGLPIADAPPNPRRIVQQGSIVIERLAKNDTGNYGCNATNSLGYVYKDVYVNVLALAPEITTPPTDKEVVDGKTVTLTCRVFGAPKPEVKWVHQNDELTGGRYTVLPEGDLEIRDVYYSDAGQYTCHATNKLGEEKKSAFLSVKEHTRITDAPEDYEVAAGVDATFRCNAVSDSSLPLTINWLNNGELIDLDSEPRFVRSNDYSLTITKTTELDSGTYTCVASTPLDNATAQATLTVQDVPNAPRLLYVQCNKRDAAISWTPMGDNRAPILRYTIQYNTTFNPDTWENAYDNVPATDNTYTVAMSPWANYTFRVIAWNKIGPSLPSEHSKICTTQMDVPYKNPDNVEGKGTEPNNMVIRWTPMQEIEHNAPRFQYRVYWRRDVPGDPWSSNEVTNWRQSEFKIPNLPTFQKFHIKVVAINEEGEANVSAKEVIGYSGEDVPMEAPTNFTLVEITSSNSAMLSWNPVSPTSVRGHFKGYKIQTWTEKDGQGDMRETLVKDDSTKALITKFVPNAKNFARILAYNSRYNGPPSEVLEFNTPEGVPGPVQSAEAIPMGSSALLLLWKKPEETNGIYYQTVTGTKVGPLIEKPPINDPNQTRAKLAGLEPATKYRIHINATTAAGEGSGYFIELKTKGTVSAPPDVPKFKWYRLPLKDETMYQKTSERLDEDFIIVRGLQPSETYEFKVVSVDGGYMTESEPEYIETYNGPMIEPKQNVATAGWFIGMLLAIIFLLLVLILVCIIKRNRGGKYAVHEREAAHGRHDYPDDPGFQEYSQPLDSKSHGRGSMASDPKAAAESDTDSMAEYGEGDTEGMNEDGSFIGQYGKQKRQGETSSGGFATLV
ncbi:hypothetical protein AAG570_008019, partial [Ranatra chinensis]